LNRIIAIIFTSFYWQCNVSLEVGKYIYFVKHKVELHYVFPQYLLILSSFV